MRPLRTTRTPHPNPLPHGRGGPSRCPRLYLRAEAEPWDNAARHLSRPGEVESARADRVRGATSPDNAHPSPQPSP
ncbi:hypothetical protein F6X53_21680 [Methylobacterium soli]|uniref:Uncharacterized protein n=1 Tax=Methylobacterium soli TaxID=553447 RepID=A0A6L3SVH1_9HYPH|nr:hypothetical protein F6X53_21680 [Methylobacterium soli]